MTAVQLIPGPWVAVPWKNHAATSVGRMVDGRLEQVAECSGFGNSSEEGEAHARQIAAVHDMLEALRAEEEWRAREAVGALDPEWDYEIMVGAKRRAAIAKAEGSAS